MRTIKHIVIHCSYTPEGRDEKTAEIKRWHTEERGWSDIGYHTVIELDGTVHAGRPYEKIGAGVEGHNRHAIHICYVGGMDKSMKKSKDTRTVEQKKSLTFMLEYYKGLFPKAVILGHRDFKGVKKDCPSFDALNEYKQISDKYLNL
jgi:N-acetylmuramoyl-L-alanine amidase